LGWIIFPTINSSEGRARDAKDSRRYFPADRFFGCGTSQKKSKKKLA
jgi:hypothetical protein